MTKTDLDNPTFKGIVLASPGIGGKYLERIDAKRNKYKKWKSEWDKTDETYRFRNGQKSMLPKYYKEKIYTEDERQILWIEKMQEGYQYVMGEKFKVTNEKEETEFEQQRKHIENAGLSVGLMYGGSGAGSTSTAGGQATQPSGPKTKIGRAHV